MFNVYFGFLFTEEELTRFYDDFLYYVPMETIIAQLDGYIKSQESVSVSHKKHPALQWSGIFSPEAQSPAASDSSGMTFRRGFLNHGLGF